MNYHFTEETLPLTLRKRVEEVPDTVVQYAKDGAGRFQPRIYQSFYDEIREAAAGLLELGARRGDHIGLISDNRREWLVSDFAVLSLGAADVPRGCDSTVQELSYILSFTGCAISFAENSKQVLKILECAAALPALKILITYEKADAETAGAAEKAGLRLCHYDELIALGKKRRSLNPGEIDREIDQGKRDDLATIIFTSGTTGEPKGVMLTHGTFLHQLPSFYDIFDVKPGDIWLSVLPVWHVFERIIEYAIIYTKSSIAYSKPISSIWLADFKAVRPHWMVSVPRIWEAVMDGIYRNIKQFGKFQRGIFGFFVSFALVNTYFKDLTFGLIPNFHGRIRAIDACIGFLPWLFFLPIRAIASVLVFRKLKETLGGRVMAGLSGGGTLPPKVDHFFNALGLRLQEAYGLSETSPVVTARQFRKARRGTVGQVIRQTEVKITSEKGEQLPPGHNGIIHVRGGQVMKGYYLKPEATAAVLSPEGWINTGDIGMMTRDNELKITGRAKDTIVLRGGENVEPVPIEQKIRESIWISHCMVVGQDQKYLAALIVPVRQTVMAFAEENNIPIVDYELLLQQPEINEVVANEVADLVSPRNGFKPFERIFKFRLIPRAFEIGTELSSKQELLRHRINSLYTREIHNLFK
jgi:long-chain acyl-CoA synthetase